MIGTVKSVDVEAGKGVLDFIDENNLLEAFFYASALAGNSLTFNAELQGQRVKFDLQKTSRGNRARNIRPE